MNASQNIPPLPPEPIAALRALSELVHQGRGVFFGDATNGNKLENILVIFRPCNNKKRGLD